MVVSSSGGDASKISVCVLLQSSSDLAEQVPELFDPRHYELRVVESSDELIEQCSQQVDCLMIEAPNEVRSVFSDLESGAILLPAVLLLSNSLSQSVFGQSEDSEAPKFFYHPAEVKVQDSQFQVDLPHSVCQAMANFMRLSAMARSDKRESFQAWFSQPTLQEKLMKQQMRLSEKLKERLGYLGVYYKRDPKQFLRNLPAEERKDLIGDLKGDYRQIILSYFRDDLNVNPMLDSFVTKAFFADISVTWMLEMHMNLMDIFAKQLKLEGRSDEVLLDYRLTLIDAIAHLSEMYRLSIPKQL